MTNVSNRYEILFFFLLLSSSSQKVLCSQSEALRSHGEATEQEWKFKQPDR